MRTVSILFDAFVGLLVAGICVYLIAETVLAPTPAHVAARLVVLICVLGVYGHCLVDEDKPQRRAPCPTDKKNQKKTTGSPT